jgi:hypothetical protein
MNRPYTPNLIEVLRATMEDVERTSGVDTDDPALAQLRDILNRRVADLQHVMASELAVAASEPASDENRQEVEYEMAS